MLKLKVKVMGLDSGGPLIAILHSEDSEELGVRSQGRIKIKNHNQQVTAIVNTTEKVIRRGEIGIFNEVMEHLNFPEEETVEVSTASSPKSLNAIRAKLRGRKLHHREIYEIVDDVVRGNLSDVEIASFVTALHFKGLELDETMNLSMAMVDTGKTLKLNKEIVVDKHSIGGVPGDKTTLLIVPIVAASGFTIPKNSSRAITSAAGTADRAETLMPVALSVEEMKAVIDKANGCIVWGGTLELSPADDIFIKVEFPLSIDPLLLPSILSKKKAVGSNFLVIDIPCGWGAKIRTLEDAHQLAGEFIELGKKMGIRVRIIVTFGGQPIGYTIGPALEAKEALENIMRLANCEDLVDKATDIAGALFEMNGYSRGKEMALETLNNGTAEKKLREIIALQGGDPNIQPDDLPLGDYRYDVRSEKPGYLVWMNNQVLVEVARKAGTPRDKGAGIQLYKKTGDQVRKDDLLFTIFAEKESKLEDAIASLDKIKVLNVGRKTEMTMSEVRAVPEEVEKFILER